MYIGVIFPGGSAVKNLPAVQTQETLVRSLGLEDLLKEGMAKHSSILTWTIPCTEKLGELQSIGSQRNMTEATEQSIAHFRVLGKTYCLISGEVSSSSELVLNTILPTVSQPPTTRPPPTSFCTRSLKIFCI